MDKVVIYIHGKGGNAGEAVHYDPLFCDCDVVGLDYTAQSPWEAKKEIDTAFGETLSWKYLCYVRENPITWNFPTHILFGEKDHLTSYSTISEFAKRINATLTVMRNGEHWFHTEEQMNFLDDWIKQAVR